MNLKTSNDIQDTKNWFCNLDENMQDYHLSYINRALNADFETPGEFIEYLEDLESDFDPHNSYEEEDEEDEE